MKSPETLDLTKNYPAHKVGNSIQWLYDPDIELLQLEDRSELEDKPIIETFGVLALEYVWKVVQSDLPEETNSEASGQAHAAQGMARGALGVLTGEPTQSSACDDCGVCAARAQEPVCLSVGAALMDNDTQAAYDAIVDYGIAQAPSCRAGDSFTNGIRIAMYAALSSYHNAEHETEASRFELELSTL